MSAKFTEHLKELRMHADGIPDAVKDNLNEVVAILDGTEKLPEGAPAKREAALFV